MREDEPVTEPPEGMSAEPPGRELPPPTRAETAPALTKGDTATQPAPAPRKRPRGNRRLAIIAGAVVVVVIAVVILVLAVSGGDGTKQMANPLEVRQLVATYQCTPGSSSSVKVTAGQEIVQLGRGGCAVVGKQLAKVDRATKVVSKSSGSGCTVTIESTAKYSAIVDKASVATDGNARALVGGGYILDLRALLYPPAKSAKLNVVFQASNQAACDQVANALRKT
jgi:hypothetical protein